MARVTTYDDELAAAYSATGAAWELGPGRIYNRLSEVLVSRSPVSLAGRTVLDVGAGTGAASRAAGAAGAVPIAADAAFGMVAADRGRRPPAVQADARALPFPSASLGGVVAAFSINHLTDPVPALREAARVTEPGGPVLVSSYAEDDGHPVKAAVEQALREVGWEPGAWYDAVRDQATAQLATVDRVRAAMRAAGLTGEVHAIGVEFPELGADDLVAWRLGMAQHAPFLATLPGGGREGIHARAVELLGGDVPTLRRSMLVLAAIV